MGIRYEILWNSLLLFCEFFWRYVRNSLLLFGESFSTYVRDVKAMAATPADVEENPNSYVFAMDMSGLKFGNIKVQVEDNVLIVSGERKREEKKEGTKYLRMERRMRKFMRKFPLPNNANTELRPYLPCTMMVCSPSQSTSCLPKKPKPIEVKID